jgi:hypothetical protein
VIDVLPWQTKPLGTGMRHFWGMPRAMRGTTPLDLARELLSSEHRHLAPGSPLPMLATLVQHWLEGTAWAFLLAAMHGTSWKMSHPAASDEATISDATRSITKHAAADAATWSFMVVAVERIVKQIKGDA